MSKRKILGLALAFVAFGGIASATIVNFDDLGNTHGVIPNGYAGFNWNNFSYLDTAWYTANYAPAGSGYLNGTVSAENVAFSGLWDQSGPTSSGSFFSISSSTAFNLTWADVTAAWYNNLNVEVIGYNGSTQVYDNNYKVNETGPSLIPFNYNNITSVEFISSGGSWVGPYGDGYHAVALDNINVSAVPEPTTMIAGALLLLPFGASTLRVLRRRTT